MQVPSPAVCPQPESHAVNLIYLVAAGMYDSSQCVMKCVLVHDKCEGNLIADAAVSAAASNVVAAQAQCTACRQSHQSTFQQQVFVIPADKCHDLWLACVLLHNKFEGKLIPDAAAC